ncbi:PAS domain-containing sensor histidine kinase [Mucilaginibacter terrae]|uniref:histidine kinase n=1 Tax=Mucilaginibacter terrae TaxID=1955052 RepID=A0ABU3H0N7_9SPHI|nr:PAS domain-containing sensor histidine kinase [Mucilaginibacter terrae]MDT3405586.1 PAS domain S-box-containing protein [Mucilaginibacter terrae]
MKLDKAAHPAGFEVLFYQNPQPMWIFDVHTLGVLEVNNAALVRYGYSRDEFLSKTIRELRPPEDAEFIDEILPQIRSTETNYREFRHLTQDGRILYAEIISYSINYNGVAARVVYARNVDEARELAGKLKLTQHRLLQILETTVIGFLQIDFDWTINYWNHAAEDLTGYYRDAVLGRKLWDVLPEIRHSNFYKYLHQTMEERHSIDFDDYFWPTQKWLVCNAYTTEEGIIIHFRDITRKRLAQENLLEKIDQLKEVSFLNSHALRKPIASLLGLTQLVSGDMITPQEFKQISALINECSIDLDNIVREINRRVGDEEYMQLLDIEASVFDFGNLVKDVVAKLQPLYKPTKIAISGITHQQFYGLRQSIEMALMYLIENAVRYSAQGSNIYIKTEIINQNIVLSVEDEGVGMDMEQLQNLFININRQKHVSATLGLPKINEVCRRHHGSMWIESIPGKGSEFFLRFPLSNVSAYKATGKTDFSVYHNATCDIGYNAGLDISILNWTGFQNYYTVRDGCLELIEILKKEPCSRVINNNSEVVGGWMDACDWVIDTLFPLAEQVGIKYVAWVYSPSTFSKLSAAYMLMKLNTSIVIEGFADQQSAEDWLSGLE